MALKEALEKARISFYKVKKNQLKTNILLIFCQG